MSKSVAWAAALSVDIEEIDGRHEVLVALIKRMHQAVHERHGSDVAKGILAGCLH